MMTRSGSGLPRKSGMSTSMVLKGSASRTRRMVSAKWAAPPSGKSSRSTEVMTTWRRFIFSAASATRRGSSGSRGAGRPVRTLQKRQLRVQVSPIMRKVAVPIPQHSPMLGQCASSQTVCRWFSLSRWLTQTGTSPVGIFIRSQRGLRR